jgi:hypothetical protein
MPVYTVHAPRSASIGAAPASDGFVFVRDGFHVWAFVAGLLWLVYHRLWWALLGYLALSLAGEVALSMLGASTGTRIAAMLVVALLMGLEAATLQRWTLSRGNWRQLDVVVADDEESAERRFFDRWTAQRRSGTDDMSIDRGAPPPTRHVAGQPFSRPPFPADHDIIGLFPQPGATR